MPTWLIDPSDPVYAGGAKFDGVTNDTAAMASAIAQAATVGGVVQLPAGKTCLVSADALACNAHSVVIESAGHGYGMGPAKPATIRFASGGAFGLKIGAASNYGSTLRFGNALRGIKLDFAGQSFTDAAIVIEGVTKCAMERCHVHDVGAASRVMRLRCVWDSDFLRNYFTYMRNPGQPLIHFDQWVTDAAGNCNNLRWLLNHFEHVDGALFHSHAQANLDIAQFFFNKVEHGTVATGSPSSNFAFDLRGCSHIEIEHNAFNNFDAAKTAGIVRFGDGADAYLCTFSRNKISEYEGRTIVTFGAKARACDSRENRHYNSIAGARLRNLSPYPNHYERIVGSVGGERVNRDEFDRQIGGGWVAASSLHVTTSNTLVPDAASVSTALAADVVNGATPNISSVVRQQSVAQGSQIVVLPAGKLRDFPVDVTIFVRCRRTHATSVASLQLNVNGALVQGSTMPPVAIGPNGLPWQVVTFTLSASSHLAGLGADVADRFQLEYGAGNAQPIDVDAVAFKF